MVSVRGCDGAGGHSPWRPSQLRGSCEWGWAWLYCSQRSPLWLYTLADLKHTVQQINSLYSSGDVIYECCL